MKTKYELEIEDIDTFSPYKAGDPFIIMGREFPIPQAFADKLNKEIREDILRQLNEKKRD